MNPCSGPAHALRWSAGVLASIALTAGAQSQYPNKPILVVAAFTAGGDSDLAARNQPPEETVRCAKKQFHTYDRLGKAIGLVLR